MTALALLALSSLVVLAVGSVARLRQGSGDEPGRHARVDGRRSGLQLRYRRPDEPPPEEEWQPQRVTLRTLRDEGLAPWPDAVGVWLPEPMPSGSLVCRTCVDRPDRFHDLVADRDEAERALVLLGDGARHRVARRCAVHATRR